VCVASSQQKKEKEEQGMNYVDFDPNVIRERNNQMHRDIDSLRVEKRLREDRPSSGRRFFALAKGGAMLLLRAAHLLRRDLHGRLGRPEPDQHHRQSLPGCRHDAVWSPEGDKILFADGHAFSGGFGLATMKPDGTDRHFISPNPATDDAEWEHQPDWESVR